MRVVLLALAVQQASAGSCCWSKWGDATSCGNYPTGGSGPICGNDGVTVCANNADCDNPAPPQAGCGTPPPAGPCPVWDGQNVYLAKAAMQGSIAVSSSTTVEEASPSIVAIAEVVRMAHMHPSGPKRTKITLGGWSDFARLATAENGVKAAKLMGKFVAYTFAQGVDIDMEHLPPFTNEFEGADEFAALIGFITQLREEFKDVAANWYDTAKARQTAMNNTYQALESWKKTNVKDYYESSIRYLGEVMEQPVPYLEISWTTRFNAFLPDTDVWNYLLPDSGRMTKNFESDNEGKKIWPSIGDKVDTINVMAYDAGTPDGKSLRFNFSTILSNFRVQGNVDEQA